MKKIVALFISCGIAFSASATFAAGNAGVGLGAVLLKGKKGKVMELAATCLNGTSGNGTFAITSGTSGYEEGALIGMDKVETFVAQNMDSLATDIARGDGEHLNTLASLMKVEDVAGFKSKMKANFDKIYPASGVTSQEVVQNINEVHNS